MALIELQDVSKVYGFGDATVLALDEVFLEVEKGEFVAIMGPSGSGKTTLLNIIGLLDRPTHGTYTLDGRHVSRVRPNRQARVRRDKIGFVFQTNNLLHRLNVIDNVALPLTFRGLTPVHRLNQASDMLERVGLREREYYFPNQLSGGQAQRVAIARALINNPSIIIADEPTGNLDSTDSRVVMELLADIHRQGNTILMVTHNPELTRYASRVLYMRDGAIVIDEPTTIGRVAKSVGKRYYHRQRKTAEDVIAGVSALMHQVPGEEVTQSPKPSKRRRKAAKRQIKRRAKQTRRARR